MTETTVTLHKRKKDDQSADSIPFGTFVVSAGGIVLIKTETEDFVDIGSGCIYSLEEFKDGFPKFKIINSIDIWFEI